MVKILIADDEPDVRDLLKEELHDAGFAVTVVPDGAEVVIAAIEQPFDLIILDMLMPGLDGLKTIRVLQKVAPGVPVLGLTGYVGRGYVADAAAMGVTVLSKPIKIAHLLAEINDVLAQTVTVE